MPVPHRSPGAPAWRSAPVRPRRGDRIPKSAPPESILSIDRALAEWTCNGGGGGFWGRAPRMSGTMALMEARTLSWAAAESRQHPPTWSPPSWSTPAWASLQHTHKKRATDSRLALEVRHANGRTGASQYATVTNRPEVSAATAWTHHVRNAGVPTQPHRASVWQHWHQSQRTRMCALSHRTLAADPIASTRGSHCSSASLDSELVNLLTAMSHPCTHR